MQDAEKVEIGYTLPKERWQEAAKNLEDLGNALAASLRAHNKDGRGAEDADELMADIMLACMALHHVAEFGLDRPPMSWQYVEIPDGMEAEHE